MSARDYQRGAVDAMNAYWASGGGNPLVDMATGTGKSIVIATLIKEAVEHYRDMRVLVLVHVKELVDQDAKALLRIWPQAPIGINSAGLGRRDRHSQILFASIQSVAKEDGFSLGPRDLVVIDECHLTPRTGAGMYRTLLGRLRERVPDLRVVGFTATPYRLDSGRLDDGEDRLFDDVVYTYGIGDGVHDGWLSPLISKATASEIDVSNVARRGGEFVPGELERAADKEELVRAAVAEMVERGADRKCWIAFCSGVQHAYSVRDEMRRQGIRCETVTGDTPDAERDRIIRDYRAGRIRCLTNAMVLTTGFDVPDVDLIAMLRPTLSTGLYVQKLGRGTRPVYPAGFDPNTATADERVAAIAAGPKPNCLVLDFSGNVRRHGPVDAIVVTGKSKKSGDEAEEERTGKVGVDDVRARPCPICRTLVAVGKFVCDQCGHEFEKPKEPPKHTGRADDTPVMSGTASKQDWTAVNQINVDKHTKRTDPTKPPTLRVDYFCGLLSHSEWVCFEHTGYAREKAEKWWRQMRGCGAPPSTIDEAILRIADGDVDLPSDILIRPNGNFVDILSRRFDPERQPFLQKTYKPAPPPPPTSSGKAWWTILGLHPVATPEEIKAAYRTLARERHPDAGGSHEAMAELNDARDRALDDVEIPF